MVRFRVLILLLAFVAMLSAVVTKEVLQHYNTPTTPPLLASTSGAPKANQNIEQATALIMKISGGRVNIVEHFEAGGGLLGFVVQEQGKSDPGGIIYTNAEGTLLISASAILNLQGENLLQRDFTRYIQPEQVTQSYQTIAKTAFLEEGNANAPHKMYVMLDPNCPHCHTAYLALQTKIQAGELAVRWIVIGNITPTSQAKALAILGADDPLKALNFNEVNFDMATHSGGIAASDTPSLLATSKLKSNNDFVMTNKLAYTPTFFYKTKEGLLKINPGGLSGEKLEQAIQSASDQF